MNTYDLPTWFASNQRYLMASLARVKQALQQAGNDPNPLQGGDAEGKAGQRAGHSIAIDNSIEQIASSMASPPSLDTLCSSFGLSEFERDILLLCAGMELDGDFYSYCAGSKGERPPYPSFGLAMASFSHASWDAVMPTSPLRYWRLLEVASGETLMTSPLRIDERVLHYLTGLDYLDERLKFYMLPLDAQDSLSPSQEKLADRITDAWVNVNEMETWPLIQLCGSDTGSKLAIVHTACNSMDAQAYVARITDIPVNAVERQSLLHLWQREVLLGRKVLVLDAEDYEESEINIRLLSIAEQLHGPMVIMRREAIHSSKLSSIRLDVKKSDKQEQYALWSQGLAPFANKLNGDLDRLVDQFNLGGTAIKSVTMEALSSPEAFQNEQQLVSHLWQACRKQARPGLDELAQRIEPKAGWDDLVLPDTQKQTLHQVVAHVRQRQQVYERWGFASKSNRGLGISALLAGASGTGKTMAAEVLAAELDLDLYRIDLSSVVSKYIGETEKNLRRVFDAADDGSAILLFDEADSLFGKRSEVKDSHDRYANIEVSYLLQRMETYTGLSILTTNLKNAIDSAFLRRIRFVIQFPFPDAQQRSDIWRRIYPSLTPTDGLEIEKLSRLNITGGNIKNIAMNAAFLAAEANEPVTMHHLLAATKSEYLKLEKPLTDSEIAGWIPPSLGMPG